MSIKKTLKEMLNNLSKSKVEKLESLLEKKAKEEKSEKDLYDVKVKKGRLTKILEKPVSEISIKNAVSKLTNWAGNSKAKQKSVRGMIAYIMNITPRNETKLIKKYDSILTKINKEFEKINNKNKK